MRHFTPGRIAVLIACVLLIALLAFQVLGNGPVTRLDEQVTLWWDAHRQPALTEAMRLVSDAHRNAVLLGIGAIVGIAIFLRGDRSLLLVLPVIPVGMLLNTGLKEVFGRPRPHLPDALVHLATFSFPSGHAVGSTVFYGAMCALVFARWRTPGARAAAVVIACVMVALVAFSRVYLAAHYVSDVVAGIAEGLACLALLLPRIPASALDSRA